MRDGLHKTLPMPRPHKRLLRMCQRPADRGEACRQAAERALEYDVSREVSPRFLRELKSMAGDSGSLLPGLSAFALWDRSRDAGGQNSPLEALIAAAAKRLEREGARGSALARSAIVQGLTDWSERRGRQAEQHCLEKGGAAERSTAQAAKDAYAGADRGAIADRLLAGGASAGAGSRRPPVSLDEDLAAPR